MAALTHGDAQDILETLKLAWERRDVDLAVSIFSEEAEYREDPFAEPIRGSNGIRAAWNEFAATTAHVEFDAERIWVVERTILASWHAAYTRRTNAERVRVRGFLTAEVDGEGKITRWREWWHMRTVGTDSTFRPEG